MLTRKSAAYTFQMYICMIMFMCVCVSVCVSVCTHMPDSMFSWVYSYNKLKSGRNGGLQALLCHKMINEILSGDLNLYFFFSLSVYSMEAGLLFMYF